MRTHELVIASIMIVSCADAPAPNAGTKIGAAGGRVATMDGAVTLEIPEGAFGSEVEVKITRLATPPSGAIGDAYEIEPSGMSFAKPIVLTAKYDPAVLAGADPETLELATYEDGTWVAEGPSVVATTDHTISTLTTHFSIWATIPAGARNPCQCHAAEAAQCCGSGVFQTYAPGSPAQCTCTGPSYEAFTDCYLLAIGSRRLGVANFCSGCTGRCCSQNGGRASGACGCVTSSQREVNDVQACASGCFNQGDPVTVCLGGQAPRGGLPLIRYVRVTPRRLTTSQCTPPSAPSCKVTVEWRTDDATSCTLTEDPSDRDSMGHYVRLATVNHGPVDCTGQEVFTPHAISFYQLHATGPGGMTASNATTAAAFIAE